MQPATPKPDVALLVHASRAGDAAETTRLTTVLYEELRRLASSFLQRESEGHTLQPTALVHEAYLRMTSQRLEWQDRAHFMAIAAQTMRRVLVDHARRRNADKRGARGELSITFPEQGDSDRAIEILALNSALERLAANDARAARVVELHFFAGLDVAEAAEVLGISPATAKRDWSFARAWLRRELSNVTDAA